MTPHRLRWLVTWAVSTTLSAACAAPAPTDTAPPQPSVAEDTAAIEALLETYDRVVTDMDGDLLLTLWDESAEISLVSPVGRVSSREELAAFFVSLRETYQELGVDLNNINIRVDGDAARATFDFDIDAVLADGTPVRFSGWETQVYRRRADGWHITHLHYSVPAVAPEA